MSKLLKQLKQQLAEKDAEIEKVEKTYMKQKDYYVKEFNEVIDELKRQLAEKENTITNLIEDTNASKEFYKKQFNEQVWLCEELREKLAEKDQDKISFCIEQLTEIRNYVKECWGLDELEGKVRLDIAKKIRLKIEEIKAIKEGK